MAGLEADTSSYNQPLPVSPLDVAGKINSLKQQGQSIDQAKLDQANQALGYMVRSMGSLGPNASKEQYAKAAQNAVDQGLVPQQQENIFLQHLQNAPDAGSFYKQFMSSAMDTQKQIELHTGSNASMSNGATDYQGKVDPLTGGFKPATQSAIQPPPTQPNVNTDRTSPNFGQPGIRGPSGPSGVVPAGPSLPVASPSGALPVPQARPSGLPVERPSMPGSSDPTGPSTQTGFDFKQRFAGEPSLATGLAPGQASAIETVGKKSGEDYATDLSRAKNLQTDLYPMNRVLDIVKEEGAKSFGPGTEGLNAVKSALVTWLPNVDQKTIDSVSNFEQAKKYLVQAARTAGNTGTNDQLAAAFEANPNVKMSGATIENVVKSNIALRKMQHAQTMLFGQQNLPPSEYSQWISKNQNVLDPRAFGYDMMSPEAKIKLRDSFAKVDKASGQWVAKDKAHEKEFKHFEQSISFANDAGLIEPPGRK